MENKNKKNSTSLINFNRRFPNEQACKRAFVDYRIKAGIKCPHCGCEAHYWLPSINRFQCKNCGCRQTLRANTVMHYSKLPFRYWFIAMWLISNTKNAFSAAEIQRQLGHEYYRPIWNMMLKIRKAMGAVNDSIVLKDNVELDECFITTKIQNEDLSEEKNWKGKKYKHKKPYRLTKTKCMIACEAIPVEQTEEQAKKYRLKYACGNLRMVVVPDFKMGTIKDRATQVIDSQSTVRSDATLSHKLLPDYFNEYIGEVINPEDISKKLPFVHIAIGNLKALIRNVHHAVEREFLQFYLNEFVYKFNHRKGCNIFNSLVLDMCLYR